MRVEGCLLHRRIRLEEDASSVALEGREALLSNEDNGHGEHGWMQVLRLSKGIVVLEHAHGVCPRILGLGFRV